MVERPAHSRHRAHRARRSASLIAWCSTLLILFASGCGLLDEFENQVAEDIKENPVIVRYIGDITSIEVDWTATGDEPGDEVFVFRVSGTKGEGVLTAECVTVDADHEDVVSGSLRVPSGKSIDLFR